MTLHPNIVCQCLSNNNIILCGRLSGGFGVVLNPYIYVEYDSSGNLNTSIGSGGIVSYTGTVYGNFGYETSISLSNNHLIFAGDYGTNVLVTKYDTSGIFDNTFGTNGISTNILGFPTSSILQSDGKIIIAGNIDDPITSINTFMISRINNNGELDITFGQNGGTITPFDKYIQ
jgi:hypothetical protein